MRHLWSFLAGLAVAPVTWVLVTLGQDGSERTVDRWVEIGTYSTPNLIEPAVYLGVAGILLGLPRQVAHDLIVQTAIGSAIMLRDSGEHPVKLREAVTSPAGTTISAIRELENHGVRAALLAALEAARDRAREIAAQST